jgi:hypothetical protein
MGILEGIVIGLVVAAVLWALRRLRFEDARRKLRELACRHDWHELDTGGDGIVLITLDSEECRRCGARR